jgi:hypothetical protein
MNLSAKLLRPAVSVIVLLAAVSVLTHNSTYSASLKSTAPIRGFYLSKNVVDGASATTACVSGYHMASIWEIHEPSNLRYDTTLGQTTDDSGSGAPFGSGWVRTGFLSNGGSAQPAGFVNCNAWTSNASSDNGSQIGLFVNWDELTTMVAIAPWVGSAQSCNQTAPVWCVQD